MRAGLLSEGGSPIKKGLSNSIVVPLGKYSHPWGSYNPGITSWERLNFAWVESSQHTQSKTLILPECTQSTFPPSNPLNDRFHPKTTPFSTRHLILVNYEVLSQLYQPMSHLFSYLNSVRHNSVIELCREQIFFLWFLKKIT